jgi:hypothetical protein
VEKADAGKTEEMEVRAALEAKAATATRFTEVKLAVTAVTVATGEMAVTAVKEAREVLVETAPT